MRFAGSVSQRADRGIARIAEPGGVDGLPGLDGFKWGRDNSRFVSVIVNFPPADPNEQRTSKRRRTPNGRRPPNTRSVQTGVAHSNARRAKGEDLAKKMPKYL